MTGAQRRRERVIHDTSDAGVATMTLDFARENPELRADLSRAANTFVSEGRY